MSENETPKQTQNEIRKHLLLDRYVIVAANRNKRPQEFAQKPTEEPKGALCFSARGTSTLRPRRFRA